ncbi:MAG: M48 family metalloprotease [Gammaproteobacteria bacterium]
MNYLKLTFVALAGWLTIAVAEAQHRDLDLQLPDIGDSAGSVVSPTEENRVGKAFFQRLRQNGSLIEDPEIVDFITYLGNRIASQTQRGEANFHFFVVDNNTVNAFALPGGYVGIHTGLFRILEREGQMAAVVAHEIAHVTQRHMARAYSMAEKMSLPTAVALLSAIILATQDAQVGSAALYGTVAGTAQAQINFTRGNEEEADRVGQRLLDKARYPAVYMAEGFKKLLDAHRGYGEGPPEYLRTHPLTLNRVAQAQARAEALPQRPDEIDLNYQLARARLMVMSSTPGDALKSYGAAVTAADGDAALVDRYGLALAQFAAGRVDPARTTVLALVNEHPAIRAFATADARLALKSGDYDHALERSASALDLWPGDYALTMIRSRAFAATGHHEKAIDLLRPLARRRAERPDIHELLGNQYRAIGNDAEAYMSWAEMHYLDGRIETAIQQLSQAQRIAGNQYHVAARIDARLKVFELEKEREKD